MPDISQWTWLKLVLFLDLTPLHLMLAVLVAVVAYALMSGALRAISRRLISHASVEGEASLLVEVLGGTHRGLMMLVAVLIGLGMLDLPSPWASRVSQLWFVALVLQFALWADRAITVGLRRHAVGADANAVTVAATLMSWGLRTLLWSIVLLAMLSNLGVNITAFVASLGVGGIAIALAAQNILGDLFASVSIAVDKPFELGDFIAFGEVLGNVEYVGIKTTRLRSLSGEQIVIGNTDLLKQTIRNYKRMQHRRTVFTFHLAYGATPKQFEQVPMIVRRAIEDSDRLRFDRAHLLGFVEQGVRFEVVYYVLDADYAIYMDEQQRINFRLMREFEAMSLRFALPVRIVQAVEVGAEGKSVGL